MAFLCAASAAASSAQIPTSSAEIRRRPNQPDHAELATADQAFREMIACVIRREPSRTRNLLATVPGTRAEERILDSFQSRMDNCYNPYRTGDFAMSLTSSLLRGGIAESYYRSDFPRGIASPPNVATEATAAWVAPRPVDGESGRMEMLHAFARCVVARRPAAVAALLSAEPLSAGENAGLRTLQPDFSVCLDSGIEFTASRQELRGLIAEAALHYAEASRDGFARPGGAERQSH